MPGRASAAQEGNTFLPLFSQVMLMNAPAFAEEWPRVLAYGREHGFQFGEAMDQGEGRGRAGGGQKGSGLCCA